MRVARSTGALIGILIVLLGLWSGLIPLVGPYFHYSFAPNSAWHLTTDRLWLDILPAAAAVLAGFALFVAGARVSGIIGGSLGVIAGAWLVVGPAVSLSWESGHGPIGAPLYSSTRQTLELVGYFYGAGALIAVLGAVAIGRFSARPALAEEAAIARTARMDPLTQAPPAPAVANGKARRRFSFPRRGREAGDDRPTSVIGR